VEQEERREGVMGKTTIFLLPTQNDSKQSRERGDVDHGGRRPSRSRRRTGVRGIERGGQGRLIPVLTLGGDRSWREIDGGGGQSVTRRLGVAVVVEQQRERGWPERCRVTWGATPGYL
jgi:hypothetical protein